MNWKNGSKDGEFGELVIVQGTDLTEYLKCHGWTHPIVRYSVDRPKGQIAV